MTQLPAHSSLSSLTSAFSRSRDPELSDLLGTHDGLFAGPWWLRYPAPFVIKVIGMPGWCGKTFRRSSVDTMLIGDNLVRAADGQIKPSVPITARIGTARLDRRPAIIIDYPDTASWPLRNITDEVRPLDDDTLLGLTYGIPAAPSTGAPFILRHHL
jgi:hypothetical protein